MSLFSSKDLDEQSLADKVSGVMNLPAGKIGKAVALYHLGNTAYTYSKLFYNVAKQRRTYNIYISSDDPLYEPVLDWLSTQGLKDASREISLSSERVWNDHSDSYSDSRLKTRYTTTKRQRIEIAGRRVWVMIEERSAAAQAVARSGGNANAQHKIVFETLSREAYEATYELLSSLHTKHIREVNPPKLYTPSGNWFRSRDKVPLRSLDSVVLKNGELDKIVSDLQEFLAQEKRYLHLGLPWHRGYLFYGDVGTGKSSIAKALAGHFGLDVYYLPLGDLTKDSDLTALLADIKPKSMLLLEDVDVFHAATSRDSESGELSLSGLLNALDGITTPHGMISVMTTNKIEKLDNALIRPGRVDVKKEFTSLDQDQGRCLFKHFYSSYPPDDVVFEGLVPSSVVGTFKQFLDEPELAVAKLRKKGKI